MNNEGLTNIANVLSESPILKNASSNLKYEDFAGICFVPSTNVLVEDLIDCGSFALLVGESNSGKTFLALDMSLAIARGRNWMGKDVKQGAVLYIAAEGGGNVKKRVQAYKQEFGFKSKPLPFRLAFGTIDLRNSSADVWTIIEAAKNTEAFYATPVRLIVIDTLNRALSGGDENLSSDMGTFIKNIDLIRQHTGATVLVIHHTGKDTKKGARGHSSLKGAIDTELSLEKARNGSSIVKATKQRDYEMNEPIYFQLKTIELDLVDSAKIFTSCVVLPKESNLANAVEKPKLNEVPRNALERLKSLPKNSQGEVVIEVWRKDFIEKHYGHSPKQTQSSAFLNAKQNLADLGYIELRGENVFIF